MVITVVWIQRTRYLLFNESCPFKSPPQHAIIEILCDTRPKLILHFLIMPKLMPKLFNLASQVGEMFGDAMR